MTRLIDADRLKIVFHKNVASAEAFDCLIDNAPTVDAIPIEYIRKWVLAQGYGRKQGWFITLRNLENLIKDWEAENETD